jgi:hypothetical protein
MTAPTQPTPTVAQLEAVLHAAAQLWRAMNDCPVPMRTVVGPERASVQVVQRAGSGGVRQRIVAEMGELLGTDEPGLVCDGVMVAMEAAGLVADIPVHAFTFLDLTRLPEVTG